MSLLVSVDIGTTSITALALDAASGELVARHTLLNTSETTSPDDKARGRSEWDAAGMVRLAGDCLHHVARQVGARTRECLGLGITGQQHGVVLVDEELRPLTPFVGWQDRRATTASGGRQPAEDVLEPFSGSEIRKAAGTELSLVERAQQLVGRDAPRRAGCRLASGYMATTLYWMKVQGALPTQRAPATRGTACFIADLFGASLTGERPVTDPTLAASSGVVDVANRRWDDASLDALGLSTELFPEIREAGRLLGKLTSSGAEQTGLPQGMPVFVALGDNQASFLGSVADRRRTVLVNVGTGAQVAAFAERFRYAPPLETRPFPIGGNLLVNAGLCGGRSYAVLEHFFAGVLERFAGGKPAVPLYEAMNQLAASVPRGADGLRCVPLFTGTRAEPLLRASLSGAAPENFTAAHVVRALLEGMARVFREGFDMIRAASGATYDQLVGSGNGLRENPVLAGIVAEEFGLPLTFPRHREEAAVGAALVAAVGAGVSSDLGAAGKT